MPLKTWIALWVGSNDFWLTLLIALILIGCILSKVLIMNDDDIDTFISRGKQ